MWEDEALALKILSEFSLSSTSHIINGHIPVRVGENPIKGGGRVIVIDGGFCSAYRKITGICGYTLIYDSRGMHLCAHEAFAGKNAAIQRNADILSKVNVFESSVGEIRVRESDEGFEIRERIADLIMLLEAYKNGDISEKKA